MTHERGRGTMETVLGTPVRPFEMMVGKIPLWMGIGPVQLGVTLGAAWLVRIWVSGHVDLHIPGDTLAKGLGSWRGKARRTATRGG